VAAVIVFLLCVTMTNFVQLTLRRVHQAKRKVNLSNTLWFDVRIGDGYDAVRFGINNGFAAEES
jgi:hypothetical protein